MARVKEKKVRWVSRIFLDTGDEVLDPAKPDDAEKIADTICALESTKDLTSKESKRSATFHVFARLGVEQQIQILRSKKLNPTLTGYNDGDSFIEILAAYTIQQRAEVLPFVASCILNRGIVPPAWRDTIFNWLTEFDDKQVTNTLSADGVICGLVTDEETAEKVIRILEPLSDAQLARAWNAASAQSKLRASGTPKAIEKIEARVATAPKVEKPATSSEPQRSRTKNEPKEYDFVI